MIRLRKAEENEAEMSYSFINEAREYHREMGFEQWHPDYPTLNTIWEDIHNETAYVFVNEEDKPIGYCCISFGEEQAYKNIYGSWKKDEPYAVVHRMAFTRSVRGGRISGRAFELIKELCRNFGVFSIRVDTQEENKVMQHILDREGFVYCGLVQFDGGPKLAYELEI